MQHTLKMMYYATVFCATIVLSLADCSQAKSLTIATDSKSTFTIVVPRLAPVSVTAAATEMQRAIEEADGQQLFI